MEISKIMPFYRWHPEVAIRYLPVVREIKKLGRPTVLEIGSGTLGIAPYLGRKVVGLDTRFSGPFHPLLEQKIGSGTEIPFKNKSFDVVISVDSLEHIKPQERSKFISEMKRVAGKEIIIAVPTGEKSLEQDRTLNGNYRQTYGRPYPFLDEQIDYGLPAISQIKSMLGDNVKVENNEPLSLRLFLMRGWMKPGLLSKIFYWKIILLFIPLFKLFDRPPYYRTIFYQKL